MKRLLVLESDVVFKITKFNTHAFPIWESKNIYLRQFIPAANLFTVKHSYLTLDLRLKLHDCNVSEISFVSRSANKMRHMHQH